MNKPDPKIIASYKHWQQHPLSWVKDKFSQALKDKRMELPDQHIQFWEELGKLLRAKLKVRFQQPFESEEEKEYAGKIGISIMAAKGVGKDFSVALLIAYFMDVWPAGKGRTTKVPCTGVGGQHLKAVLWSEVSKVLALANRMDKDPRSPTCLEAIIQWQSGYIFNKSAKETWFAEAVTINRNSSREDQAKTLYGRHADHMAIIVDEADGVPDIVFGPLEDTLTSPINFAVFVFNPTRTAGYAYNTHYDPIEMTKWVRLQWSALDSPLVTQEHIANMAKKGTDTAKYRIGVLGLPPLTSEGGLFVDQWLFDAQFRDIVAFENDPIIAGIDVGGGGDASVIAIRKGGCLLNLLYNHDKDPMMVVDWIASNMAKHDIRVGIVDVVGLGAGVYSRLNQMGINVRPWDTRNTSRYPEKYYNRRSEMYMNLREMLAAGTISFKEVADNCADLMLQARVIGYEPERKCKVQLKSEVRRALGGDSPDDLDAVALSVAYPDEMFRTVTVSRKPIRYQPMGIV